MTTPKTREVLYRCTSCGGVYLEAPTQCDCMPDVQEYEQGVALFTTTTPALPKPVGYARRWFVFGEKPYKEKLPNGRMAWAKKFRWNGVTQSKILHDDKPLYTAAQLQQVVEQAQERIAQLEAARIAYASEFPVIQSGEDAGLPDVGRIHENIRKLKAQAKREPMTQSCSDLDTGTLIGLTVSVDVSTGDADSGNRLFGTVYEVQEDTSSKGGITLLVADVEANFEQAKREPMTSKQLREGREAIFSTSNPFCPCDQKTFDKVAAYVEAFHNIGDKA